MPYHHMILSPYYKINFISYYLIYQYNIYNNNKDIETSLRTFKALLRTQRTEDRHSRGKGGKGRTTNFINTLYSLYSRGVLIRSGRWLCAFMDCI